MAECTWAMQVGGSGCLGSRPLYIVTGITNDIHSCSFVYIVCVGVYTAGTHQVHTLVYVYGLQYI